MTTMSGDRAAIIGVARRFPASPDLPLSPPRRLPVEEREGSPM